MAQWLSKIVHALSGQADQREAVRQALLTVQRARSKLALSMVSGNGAIVMSTTIEQVREDDIVISQPSIGGLVHPLAFGEAMTISFVNQSLYHSGDSRCLGRIKIAAGGGSVEAVGEGEGAVLFAYRLALPETMHVEDRRRQPRVNVNFANPPEAQLYASDTGDGPLLGAVNEIGMDGARITTNLPTGKLHSGGQIFLKAMLPEPVGLVDELVDVARVDNDQRTGKHVVAVQFRRKLEGLDILIRASQHVADSRRKRAG